MGLLLSLILDICGYCRRCHLIGYVLEVVRLVALHRLLDPVTPYDKFLLILDILWLFFSLVLGSCLGKDSCYMSTENLFIDLSCANAAYL